MNRAIFKKILQVNILIVDSISTRNESKNNYTCIMYNTYVCIIKTTYITFRY